MNAKDEAAVQRIAAAFGARCAGSLPHGFLVRMARIAVEAMKPPKGRPGRKPPPLGMPLTPAARLHLRAANRSPLYRWQTDSIGRALQRRGLVDQVNAEQGAAYFHITDTGRQWLAEFDQQAEARKCRR